VSIRLSACPCVRPHGIIRLPLNKFSRSLIFKFLLENLSRELKFQARITDNEGQYSLLIIYCSFLLIIRNVSDKSCRENQNTFYVPFFFPRKSFRLRDNAEKYCTAGQATDDSIAHANCMLDH
jgi:hypothetical protein